jgi:hypothetical protein
MSLEDSNNGSVVQPSDQHSLTETDPNCAEFWPSPIAWARDHEATVPADSIDLWPTPLGWSADLREATK